MSNLGQAVLTIGGTIVGGFFGNPQLGYLLGSLAGQAAFPTKLPTVRGPRLEDAKLQTSSLGAPIPWVWGTYILAGNVMWRSPFIERKVKEKAGGKGGPEQTAIHFEYRVNVAVGLCGRPPTRAAAIAGIRRIWADSKLIYDASAPVTEDGEGTVDPDSLTGRAYQDYLARLAASQARAVKFDLYLGTEAQNPDATIESWEGVGEVPAYRSLAYIVFRDFELADYGNRIPNFRVEVVTDGAVSEVGAELYSNDILYPWLDGFTRDPRNPLNNHEYNGDVDSNYTSGWTSDYSQALQDLQATSGRVYQEHVFSWSKSSTPNSISWCDGENANLAAGNDRLSLWLWHNINLSTEDSCESLAGPTAVKNLFGIGNVGHARRAYYVATNAGESEEQYFLGYSQPGNMGTVGSYTGQTLSDHRLKVRRNTTPPDGCQGLQAVPGTDDYCVTMDGAVLPAINWVETAGTWHVLRKYDDNSSNVTSYPLNPVRPLGHAEYNDQAFWEAAYASAVASGDMESGLVYGVDYPQTQSYAYVGSFGGTIIEPDPVPLSEIVADICEGCGLEAYDVGDLASTLVHGYALTSPCSGREGIDPLRPFGYFDAVESEFELKFVQRGHAAVATIDAEDLGARLTSEERQPSVSTVRGQDEELPRMVRAHFIDLARDGDPGQTEQQRQTVNSVNTVDLQVPVVMNQERGQAMVDAALFEAWIARNGHQFSLPFLKYPDLEPTDCVIVPINGVLERVRIVKSSVRALAVLDVNAVRDDAAVYTGTDIVGEYLSRQKIQPGGVPSPTELILLELPSLRSVDDDCGYYAAARGLLPGWPGAVIYRATSPSGTFRQVAWTSVAATIGAVTESEGVDTVADSGETGTDAIVDTSGIDQTTVIRAVLYSGTFESVSQADMLSGENVLAVGDEGDWELIRFQIATQDSDGVWTLSNLMRAQSGTTQRRIITGDRVVLMTGPGIMRIEETADAEDSQRVLRAVTSGTSLEDAEDHYITTQCLSQPADDDEDVDDGGAEELPRVIVSADLCDPPTETTTGQSTGGHWAQFQFGNDDQADFQAFVNEAPEVVGILQRFPWYELETSPGVFDFTVPLANLAWCAARGKKYSWMLVDRSFNTDASGGANLLPTDLQVYSDFYSGSSTSGYAPYRWNATVRTRFLELVDAWVAAADSDPDYDFFEGIVLQESAIGLSTTQLNALTGANDYSPAIYGDHYIAVIQHLAVSMPGKRVTFFGNFISGDQSQIDRVINETKTLGTVELGGPDWWPASSDGAGLRSSTGLYSKMVAHQNDCPLSIGFSIPSYGQDGYSLSALFQAARDDAKVNKIYWMNPLPTGAGDVIGGNPTFNVESWGTEGTVGPSGWYYVPLCATGEWADHIGELAQWNDETSVWEYTNVCGLHLIVWDQNTSQHVVLDCEGGYEPLVPVSDTSDTGGGSSLPAADWGDILYRGAADWELLAAGTAGEVLSTNGASADPAWISVAEALGGVFGAYATTDQTKNQNTTLADDDVLFFTLVAGKKYVIVVQLGFETDTSADLKWDFNYTGTVASYDEWLNYGTFTLPGTGTTTGTSQIWASAINTLRTFNFTGAANLRARLEIAIETTTGGTFSFRWAQANSINTDTVRRRNSNMVAIQVS